MPDDPIAIVRKSFQAYVDDDRAAIESVIAEDFHFTSPLDNRIDRKTYFERCWANHEWITGFDFVSVIAEGGRVAATYIGQSNRGKAFRNTEIFTVKDGKITEVDVYFGWSIPHEAADGGFVTK